MIISLIWAMAEDRVIGVENRLPWRLPADMKWFRLHTLGKPIIMGRKTFESFGAKPLPQRTNIVITKDKNYQADGILVVHSIEDALAAAGDVEEVMIIGGMSFYKQMLPQANKLYMTLIHQSFDGDAWFPEFDMSEWQEQHREDHQADEKNSHSYSFVTMTRKTV
ncbi:MAG: type 3 dihydrofolate reductase [Gammaproteobacteria bacterium]|nr:type 3 dihydrofolate reductase [Gammaproteobacteria bacterium]